MKLFIIIASIGLSACTQTLLPIVPNNTEDPVKVFVADPSASVGVQSTVVRLYPDEKGCLIPYRLSSASTSKYFLNAKPGDIIAIALASEYSVSTKRSCKASYSFKIEEGVKKYEIGSLGTCSVLGVSAKSLKGYEGISSVKLNTFDYPISPNTRIEKFAPKACIKAPQGIF
jgi:hypothetical protein